jgi:dihydroorotase
VFDDAGALDRLEGFASVHGARSTACRATRSTVTLERAPWTVPADYPFGADRLVPLCAGNAGWRSAAGAGAAPEARPAGRVLS